MEYRYRCNNCGHEFDEPDTVRTTYEDYYGVSSDFPDSHAFYYGVCPMCHDGDYDEIEEDEEEEEE